MPKDLKRSGRRIIRCCLGLLFPVSLVWACESDPLLAPTNEEPEDKGSYGILIFDPKANNDGAKVAQDKKVRLNPKLF